MVTLVLEEEERAKPLKKIKRKTDQRTVLIAGSEVTGVDPELLGLCDDIFYIPTTELWKVLGSISQKCGVLILSGSKNNSLHQP